MKGIVFTGMVGYQTFPSVAKGSGNQQLEDTYQYMKRDIGGEMRRISRLGRIIRMECKWSALTARQYDALVSYIKSPFFPVRFMYEGQAITTDFYAGNISATPFMLDSDGNPRYYLDVSFPIISRYAIA